MRPTRDIAGHRVHVMALTAHDTYAGMLEGTPRLSLKWRSLQGRKWIETPGRVVHGLDEIEQAMEASAGTAGDWPANECWEARIVDDIDFDAWTRRALDVRWYQEGGDPMARLHEILAGIDFVALAVTETVDPA